MTEKGHQMNIFELFAMEAEAAEGSTVEKKQETNGSVQDDINSLVQDSGETDSETGKTETTAADSLTATDQESKEAEEAPVDSKQESEEPQAAPNGKPHTPKKSATSKKSAAATSPTVTKKPKITEVDLGGDKDWKVRYAGTTYHLNLLFEEEILDGKTTVTLEEIREKLVTTEFCIELSPKRAYWEVEEPEQLLILICKGQDKGAI